MARPQLVGRKIATGASLTTSGATISLTDLAGGLASSPADGDTIFCSIIAADNTNDTLAITDASDVDYSPIDGQLYANDTYDTNQYTGFKRCGASPDTSLKVDTNATTDGYVVLIEVWRGVHLNPIIDGAIATTTANNGGRPNPAAVTPSTADSVILVFGGAANSVLSSAFTSSDLSDFQSDIGDGGSRDAVGGMGYYEWTSGSFDPVAWQGSSTSTAASCTSITFAIAPFDPDYVPPVEFKSSLTVDGSGTNFFVNPASLSPAYAENDILILVVIDESASPDYASTPSGWTLLDRGLNYSSNASWGVFAKKAEASEGSITLNLPNGWTAAAAALMCFGNAGAVADILDAFLSGTSAPSLAGALAGDMALQGIFATNEPTFVGSRPSGYSDTAINSATNGSGSDSDLAVFHDEITADGTVSSNSLASNFGSFYRSFTIIIPADRGAATQDLTPGLLTNTSTLYAPTVSASYQLTAPLLTSSAALFAPTVAPGAVTLSPPLLTSSATFYGPAISTGPVTIAAPLLTSSSALFAPTVAPGAVTLSPPLLSNAQTFFAHVIVQGFRLEPPLLTNVQTFFGPAISTGPVTIAPPLLTSSAALFAPTVAPGAVTLSPPLLTSSPTFYGPAISTGPVTIAPPLLTSSAALFAPTVAPGAVTLSPPLLTSSAALYSPSLTPVVTLTAPLLENAQTFFGPVVSAGSAQLSPPLLTNAQTFFGPVVSAGAVTLSPPLLTSSSTLFAPSVLRVVAVITPPGRRLTLVTSRVLQRRLALDPSILLQRRLALGASRVLQRRLALDPSRLVQRRLVLAESRLAHRRLQIVE